jgi:predicted nucleic acid-binding protein
VTVFADSSALVKLYAEEAGREDVEALSAVAIAQVARVEVPAALWRKHRLGQLSVEDAGVLTAEFEADYFGGDGQPPRFAAVAVVSGILDEATRACAAHGLRAYDAIQLSSALTARRLDPGCDTMAVFDHHLRRAAAAEGFSLVPATLTFPADVSD